LEGEHNEVAVFSKEELWEMVKVVNKEMERERKIEV
jgi:hypothetical protein